MKCHTCGTSLPFSHADCDMFGRTACKPCIEREKASQWPDRGHGEITIPPSDFAPGT